MTPTSIFAVLTVALVARMNVRAAVHKIFNRSPAVFGEFPYQASVKVTGEHFCSGTIVSPHHIVTAAHCVAGLTLPVVVVTGTITSCYGHVHMSSKIEYHEKFADVNYPLFDIAIIIIDTEIVFSIVQNMIALPIAPTPPGVIATASGWGYLSESLPMISVSLNRIQLKTISRKKCQQLFGPKVRIYKHQICTYSSPGSGVCAADSGGPLAVNGELIGVLSWGIPCSEGLPDVFTSVYHLLPWVHSIINRQL